MPQKKSIKLCLVINSLTSGGAERVASTIANYWAENNYQITILTFDDGSEPPFYDLVSKIQHIPMGIAKESSNLFDALFNTSKRLWRLRKIISNLAPDVIISFLNTVNILTLIATKGLKIPVVISEHIDPYREQMNNQTWYILRQWTYSWASCLVTPSNGVMNYFGLWNLKMTAIIPNPVTIIREKEANQLTGEKDNSSDNFSIIAVGRLEQQKRFDLLINSFAQLKDLYPNWQLNIFGEGQLRSELEFLCEKLNLCDRVFLPGRVKNIHNKMRQSDLFVLSSSYEGFGMVIVEAMACGLPVISTDCPSGPSEIITNNVDGILVPNENAKKLVKAMDYLMSNPLERKKLGENALKITERFGLEKVMAMWRNLLNNLLN